MSEESKKLICSNNGGGSGYSQGNHAHSSKVVSAQPMIHQQSHQAIGKELQKTSYGQNGQKNRKKGKKGNQYQMSASAREFKPYTSYKKQYIEEVGAGQVAGKKSRKSGKRSLASDDPNSWVAFYTHEPEPYIHSGPVAGHGGRNRKNRKQARNSLRLPEYTAQASFRFIVNPIDPKHQIETEVEYDKYLKDPSSKIDWNHVVEVQSSNQTQCPICMETGHLVVAPRAIKCGCHVFCYPCLLQYIDYEYERPWYKCPTCKDPIYKYDIRRATILENKIPEETKQQPSAFAAPGSHIEFRLMVRNKSNISVKYKTSDSTTVYESVLPSVRDKGYEKSRVRVGDEEYIRKVLNEDLVVLQKDLAEKKSSQSLEQVPYVQEAIAYHEYFLSFEKGTLTSLKEEEEDQEPMYVSVQYLNKQKSKELEKKKSKDRELVIAENEETCFYFYYAVAGENHFLDPLCHYIFLHLRQYQIEDALKEQNGEYQSEEENEQLAELPLSITGVVLETTQGGLTANGKYPHDMTFLCHLPPGASYHTVEIDLKTSKPYVPDGILRLPEYQKRLKERRVKRQSKRAEEDKYSEMVAKEFDRKDEHYKNQAGVYIYSKPEKPIMEYLAEEQKQLEEEEKKQGAKPKAPYKTKSCAFLDDSDDDPGFDGYLQKGPKQAPLTGYNKYTSGPLGGGNIWYTLPGLGQQNQEGFRLDHAVFRTEQQVSQMGQARDCQKVLISYTVRSLVKVKHRKHFQSQLSQKKTHASKVLSSFITQAEPPDVEYREDIKRYIRNTKLRFNVNQPSKPWEMQKSRSAAHATRSVVRIKQQPRFRDTSPLLMAKIFQKIYD